MSPPVAVVSGEYQPSSIRKDEEDSCVVDQFIAHLSAHGLDTVFGIPGGLLAPLFMAVEQSEEIRLVVSKHEQGAAFMADGYYRASERMAIAAATSGPGATNLITAVSCAFTDGVPMLVLTGQVNSANIGRGACQEAFSAGIDIVGMFRSITKYSVAVDSPEMLLFHFLRGMRLARPGRPGPVHLSIPVNFWKTRTNTRCPDPRDVSMPSEIFDANSVKRAAAALLEARYPLFLVGAGAASAQSRRALYTLLTLTNARVVTSPRGKGIVADDHPACGGVLGLGGNESASRLAKDSRVDVLFSIGASLGETTAVGWDEGLVAGRTLVQLDIDGERIGRNYPVDIPLLGDCAAILDALVYYLEAAQSRDRCSAKWRGEQVLASSTTIDSVDSHYGLHPIAWRNTIAPLLPQDAIVFSDIGGHMLFNLRDLRITGQQQFIINMGFASMGHGTVAPIGAAMSGGKAPVIAIVGDACIAMNGNELLTAAEYNVKVIWIVENNQMHGISWHGSKLDDRQLESIVYQRPVNIAKIAEAMNVSACRVTSLRELEERFIAALSWDGPYLIEVMTDANIAPPVGARVKSFAGYKS